MDAARSQIDPDATAESDRRQDVIRNRGMVPDDVPDLTVLGLVNVALLRSTWFGNETERGGRRLDAACQLRVLLDTAEQLDLQQVIGDVAEWRAADRRGKQPEAGGPRKHQARGCDQRAEAAPNAANTRS